MRLPRQAGASEVMDMELVYFEYALKDGKGKGIAVDAQSVLDRMAFLEEFGGTHSAESVAQHWYALKRELLGLLVVPEVQDVPPKEP